MVQDTLKWAMQVIPNPPLTSPHLSLTLEIKAQRQPGPSAIKKSHKHLIFLSEKMPEICTGLIKLSTLLKEELWGIGTWWRSFGTEVSSTISVAILKKQSLYWLSHLLILLKIENTWLRSCLKLLTWRDCTLECRPSSPSFHLRESTTTLATQEQSLTQEMESPISSPLLMDTSSIAALSTFPLQVATLPSSLQMQSGIVIKDAQLRRLTELLKTSKKNSHM